MQIHWKENGCVFKNALAYYKIVSLIGYANMNFICGMSTKVAKASPASIAVVPGFTEKLCQCKVSGTVFTTLHFSL
jgi:hypothetical protein